MGRVKQELGLGFSVFIISFYAAALWLALTNLNNRREVVIVVATYGFFEVANALAKYAKDNT